MKKQYVPKSLTEYLGESNITLKRKYGERPNLTAGLNAPLRNQVLSFIAESGSVSKRDLKQFIMGLKEGGSTPASATMFIKRNGRYFLTESVNGITYFRLSDLGKRLVNRFVSLENKNVSEAFKKSNYDRKTLNQKYEEQNPNQKPEFEDDETANDFDEVGPAEEVDFDDDRFSEDPEEDINPEDLEDDGEELEDTDEFTEDEVDIDDDTDDSANEVETDQFEYEEDDEKIVLTYWKDTKAHGEEEDLEGEEDFDHNEINDEKDLDEDELKNLKTKDDLENDDDSDEDIDPEDLEDDEDLDEDELDEEDLKDEEFENENIDENDDDSDEDIDPEDLEDSDEDNTTTRPKDEPREYDFKDKGRPGLHDMDESAKVMKAQFVSHKLTGKKSPNLGGKLDKSLHNLLADNQDKDDSELTESTKNRLKSVLEELRAKREAERELFEAEKEASEDDELKDEDLDKINTEETPEEEQVPEEEPIEGEEDVEKIEITEFIITVDDVDEAIDELAEIGVTAERVPVEPKEEEIPADVEEEPSLEDVPAEGEDSSDADSVVADQPEENPEEQEKVKESLDEAEQPADDLDLGTSDELGLGNQGEDAPELDDQVPPEEGEETTEPTTEFEENKIKVPADKWPELKNWLEEKGVDIKAMFGGEIELEEVSDDEVDAEVGEEPSEEVDDSEIDFSGVSDKETGKVSDKKEEKTEKE